MVQIMTARTTLEKAFNAYLDLAKAELRPRQMKTSSERPLQLLETKSMELRRLVEGIETRHEFRELVKQTLSAFPAENSGEAKEEQAASRSDEIQNFFRRSRCYMSIYNGQDVDPKAMIDAVIRAFRNEEVQVNYCMALGGINFHSDDDIIQIERLQIRRFSAEELKEILQNDVNDVFYESSSLNSLI